MLLCGFFFFQAEDGIRDRDVTGVQTCALPIYIASATGGAPPYTFSITPAMPAGLIFDTTNGDISGTATTPQSLTLYTIQVTDSLSATDSGPLYIELQ